jgi:hypothetical protein
MPLDLPLRCRCGRTRGVATDVSPSTGFRFVCYCKDCQAFAHFLERTDVLDPAGGTDIFQMPPGRVKLTAGTDAMRCLRLSNRVLSWYTDCCRTPIANTAAGPRFPVIGVVHSFMDHEAAGRSRDEVLGPPLCRIYERSAVGPLPPDAPNPPSLGVFARRASKMLGWVGTRAQPTHAVLRRSDEGSARRAARAHAERARRSLIRSVTASSLRHRLAEIQRRYKAGKRLVVCCGARVSNWHQADVRSRAYLIRSTAHNGRSSIPRLIRAGERKSSSGSHISGYDPMLTPTVYVRPPFYGGFVSDSTNFHNPLVSAKLRLGRYQPNGTRRYRSSLRRSALGVTSQMAQDGTAPCLRNPRSLAARR